MNYNYSFLTLKPRIPTLWGGFDVFKLCNFLGAMKKSKGDATCYLELNDEKEELFFLGK